MDLEAGPGSIAARFDSTLRKVIERRIKGGQDKPKKTLFGDDLPPAFYLTNPAEPA